MAGQIRLVAIFILVLAKSVTESKNVVFLPFMITSHTRLHAVVAEELAKMGHNVWLGLSSAVDKRNVESYQGVTTFRLNEFWEASEDMVTSRLEETVNKAIETGAEPEWDWVFEYVDFISEIYFKAMKDGKLMKYIESLKPDLIVLDWNPKVNEKVAIAYKLKVPFAILSALQDHITARVPINPVADAYNSPYFRSHATLFEKVQTVIQNMSPLFKHIVNDRGYMKRLFPDDPDVPAANELMSQAEVYIVESDPIFDYPCPVLPNLKLIGGLSAGPAKELQEPFKSFLGRSQNAGVGVAVLSFGSLFMNLPKKIEVKLVAVLRRIKLNTIWRANITSPDPDKILTSTWLPVNDLLGNKNVKVFITHSGVHSIYEGIHHGVPMVCLPMFFDQLYNAERAVEKDYCLSLDFLKASEDQLVNVIEEVVSSQKIRSSIGTASEIYRQLYKDPKKEAAFWLDHVMRYGGSYMRYSGQKIPMYLFLLDYFIVFLAGVVFAVGIFLICFLIKRLCRFFCSPRHHIKKD